MVVPTDKKESKKNNKEIVINIYILDTPDHSLSRGATQVCLTCFSLTLSSGASHDTMITRRASKEPENIQSTYSFGF